MPYSVEFPESVAHGPVKKPPWSEGPLDVSDPQAELPYSTSSLCLAVPYFPTRTTHPAATGTRAGGCAMTPHRCCRCCHECIETIVAIRVSAIVVRRGEHMCLLARMLGVPLMPSSTVKGQ